MTAQCFRCSSDYFQRSSSETSQLRFVHRASAGNHLRSSVDGGGIWNVIMLWDHITWIPHFCPLKRLVASNSPVLYPFGKQRTSDREQARSVMKERELGESKSRGRREREAQLTLLSDLHHLWVRLLLRSPPCCSRSPRNQNKNPPLTSKSLPPPPLNCSINCLPSF